MKREETRQEITERLQDWAEKSYVLTAEELKKECEKETKKCGEEIDWFDDILSPLEWNCCDRCGALYPSETLFWESADWGYENKKLVRGIQIEKAEYMALCEECVAELEKKGAKDIITCDECGAEWTKQELKDWHCPDCKHKIGD